jgi:glyoxylase-like metal-dependent hydrolase (beta-lactamase superfamily II)
MPNPTFVQITPHIYKLNLGFLGGRYHVGVWLVRGDDGWTVVDTGLPDLAEQVMQQILNQTGGEIPKQIILTHGHWDHAGAAQAMREKWKAPLAAGRDEFPYLVGPSHYNRIKARTPLYRILQISPPALVGRNIQLPLDEGMRLDGLEVFHVPGHAPGMIALLHAGDRALISGDTFGNMGGKLEDPPDYFTYDPALNRRSQAKLAALDFDHLLVSHGSPVMNEGQKQARALVESREKKKK